MTPETVIDIGKGALQLATIIVLIVLVPALAVGLLVSMFQAATQINENTLSFVPKLIITFLVLIVCGSWILGQMMDFTKRLFENIPMVIG